jgi:uncharacterized protein YgiM (DUF1202 family)
MTRRLLPMVMLLVLAASVAGAQTSRWVERTKVDVRAGRGSYFEVVDTVLKGEQVEIVKAEARWLSVRTPRAKVGWIFETALAAQPVSTGTSDFLKLVPGDASTSATAASTGAKGLYAEDYARQKGFDYGAVLWIEETEVTAEEMEKFVVDGRLRGAGGAR